MPKRRTVTLPSYPALLLETGKANEKFPRYLDAVAVHYGITGPYGPPRGFPIGDPPILMAAWRDLAVHLLSDFVPAFRGIRRGGAPRQGHTQRPPLAPHAHEARLVQMINELRSQLRTKGMPSTNAAAYRALIRLLASKPAPQWRFGKLKTTSSFAQAWKAIPQTVKQNPELFLPQRAPKSNSRTDSHQLPFSDVSIDDIWRALPELPGQNAGSRTKR